MGLPDPSASCPWSDYKSRPWPHTPTHPLTQRLAVEPRALRGASEDTAAGARAHPPPRDPVSPTPAGGAIHSLCQFLSSGPGCSGPRGPGVTHPQTFGSGNLSPSFESPLLWARHVHDLISCEPQPLHLSHGDVPCHRGLWESEIFVKVYSNGKILYKRRCKVVVLLLSVKI